MAEMKMVDLGCGKNKLEGWIGLDKRQQSDVDVVWDLENGLPFGNDSMDKIRMTEVIEHIKNYRQLINEMFRVLKKGGEVFVTTPDKNSIVNRIFHTYDNALATDPAGEVIDKHIHLFTQKELENLFSQYGFKIVESYKTPYKRWIGKFAWFRSRLVKDNIVLELEK